jgi:CBS domain-containing protein
LKIRDCIDAELVIVGPDDALSVVCRQMEARRVGSALVVEDGSLVGILTERDVVRAVAEGANPEKAQASDYMSRMLTTISADETMEDAARIMTSQRIRHLPVVDGTRIAGVLSIRDIVQGIVQGTAPDEGRHLPQLVDLV